MRDLADVEGGERDMRRWVLGGKRIMGGKKGRCGKVLPVQYILLLAFPPPLSTVCSQL